MLMSERQGEWRSWGASADSRRCPGYAVVRRVVTFWIGAISLFPLKHALLDSVKLKVSGTPQLSKSGAPSSIR